MHSRPDWILCWKTTWINEGRLVCVSSPVLVNSYGSYFDSLFPSPPFPPPSPLSLPFLPFPPSPLFLPFSLIFPPPSPSLPPPLPIFLLHLLPFPHSSLLPPSLSQGLGTDEDTLTRVIVMRSEIDLVQVMEKYREEYNETLGQAIKVHLHSSLVTPAQLMRPGIGWNVYCAVVV